MSLPGSTLLLCRCLHTLQRSPDFPVLLVSSSLFPGISCVILLVRCCIICLLSDYHLNLIMSEVDYLKSKIQELLGIIEQQNQQLQQSSSITNESIWMEPPQAYPVFPKLPTFWADKSAVWFAQAESQFALAHITSDATKFHYIVANLDSRYATEVDDIITNPPTTEMYEKLKTNLSTAFHSPKRSEYENFWDVRNLVIVSPPSSLGIFAHWQVTLG
ncbi:putative tick transposon [Trichonephila inaurata madagascariensis]|uniref:Putative tick transposon n=1 Tax=Trichonephila inaurata madagascariensis TaxID=2747483 RepID=A0A8X7BXN3_9ARAC|nr:putative tick transposon [Trichonephila inaurata madagascariensis]